MNWEAIGLVGETVGALAVVVSLGYLALQVRQNSNMARVERRDWRYDARAACIVRARCRFQVSGDQVPVFSARGTLP